jgi:hypothetical protein
MKTTLAASIRARFENYENCKVMAVECSKSKSLVFVKDENTERFYIRTGPSTAELTASQTQEYIKQWF